MKDAEQTDCLVAGASCQPWSQLRWCGGESVATSIPSEHPWYRHMTKDVPDYIDIVRPRGGVLEQVWNKFATQAVNDQGETECHLVLKKLQEQGFYTAAVRLDHRVWLSGGKVRQSLTCFTFRVCFAQCQCLRFGRVATVII